MSDRRWQVCGRAGLAWVDWGGEVAIYHRGSGDTHLLDPLAAELLRALESGPRSDADLVSLLSELVSPEPERPPQALAETILGELKRLNIIELIES
ncbi:HPr-rel-A system PqqD family peptide chaperone [Thiohalobacter thiocyanaticus]|uniref:HPr-rel-A system PqqD family peptide chaperone n=1 Tax=Thiohalobacter thiocyanaticus TaxID=585455 RepID=A0A426QM72_9GAMM|nr:HPr-rel-A system PqqD family peptide chaperone [Thiohalobacter thiocyanaticus]RRQ22855.1 HPr-rel-A system PqqD family peptide chaperone [Thiohalobacter thiocyanaticus]